MPTRLPPGKPVSLAIGVGELLQTHRDHLAQVGAIALECSYIEFQLADCYAALVDSGKDGTTRLIARTTIESALSFQRKLKLFRKAFEFRFIAPVFADLRDKAKTETKRLQEAVDLRNQVVHAQWGTCPDYVQALVRFVYPYPPSPRYDELIELDDLQNIHENAKEAIRSFSVFWISEVLPHLRS